MQNPEAAEWQTPPPPEIIERDEPQMSELAIIGNIFFEPGRTFEDLRRKPRFIIATVIVSLLIASYGLILAAKVGDAGIRQFIVEQLDKNPRAVAMDSGTKAKAVDMQMTISKAGRFASPVLIAAVMAIGGLFYWVAAKVFGGTGGFLHCWSVFVYSALPPTVISMIGNFIVLFFKSANEIDLATSQRGVIHANLAALMDGRSAPVLATLIGTIDLFMIWGWILAAIGLRITNKISSASAWAVVIIFALIGVFLRVVGAFFSGNPV